MARDDLAATLRFDGGSPLFNLLATKGARGRGSVERLVDDEKTLVFLNRAFGVVEDVPIRELSSLRLQLIHLREAVEAIFSYQIFKIESEKWSAFSAVELINRLKEDTDFNRRLVVNSQESIVIEQISSPIDARISEVITEVFDILSDSTRRSRVKVCANESCKAPFMDRSPTNNRVWCSMAICGNRAKAKRYYHSTK